MELSLLELMGRQYGVASVRQLRELGISPSTISRQRSAGRLLTVMPGVVRLAGAPDTFWSRCLALVLRTSEDDGSVGDVTGGRVWLVPRLARTRVQILVPRGHVPKLPDWAQAIRTRWPEDDRVRRADGIVVSSPERTLFVLGSRMGDARFEHAAESLWNRGLITPDTLGDWLQRHRGKGRTGVARMERWIDSVAGRDRPSQSSLEIDLIQACVALGMPAPRPQYPLVVDGGRVTIHFDAAWPEVRLGLEPGHSEFHSGAVAVRNDEERDRWCGELGWYAPRFDEVELRDLDACARQVRRIYKERLALFGLLPTHASGTAALR
jgi:hypothetical protein